MTVWVTANKGEEEGDEEVDKYEKKVEKLKKVLQLTSGTEDGRVGDTSAGCHRGHAANNNTCWVSVDGHASWCCRIATGTWGGYTLRHHAAVRVRWTGYQLALRRNVFKHRAPEHTHNTHVHIYGQASQNMSTHIYKCKHLLCLDIYKAVQTYQLSVHLNAPVYLKDWSQDLLFTPGYFQCVDPTELVAWLTGMFMLRVPTDLSNHIRCYHIRLQYGTCSSTHAKPVTD